jgi:VWFA-related protein
MLALLCVLLTCARAQEQQPSPSPKPTPDDVVRVNADLVQTDVVVLDKQRHFVDGLTRKDFVLSIDGRPQPVAFFERVTTGDANEEAQLALARGQAREQGVDPSALRPLDRGRVIFFFVDDFHLSVASAKQVRDMLRHFIETDLGQNDLMAVMSASGQVGFLQQLTDEKIVLRAAVERLKPGAPALRDYEQPTMSEYHALAIVAEHDTQVLNFYAAPIIRANPEIDPTVARHMVEARAQALLQQAANITARTLYTLEGAIQPAAALPGRKVVFFLSDGFYLDRTNTGTLAQLRRVANAAAQAGAVIYTIDTRGLSTDWAQPADALPGDPTGVILSASFGAVAAAQDPLNALAADTGGRAFLNSNALAAGISDALSETKRYYLLAWQPDEDNARARQTGRLAVTVAGHSDYTVLLRRGYFRLAADAIPRVLTIRHKPPAPNATPTPTPQTAPELISAIVAPYPTSALPTSVSVDYQDTPQYGPVVTAAVQVDSESIDFEPAAGQSVATIEVAGVVFDTDGRQVTSFKNSLTLATAARTQRPAGWRGLISQYNLQLKPGLYQVRVAARDVRTNRLGSAMRWIEIPDLTTGALALASLQLGERKSVAPERTNATADLIAPSVDGQFANKSALRFHTYVYNAARSGARQQQPDVALQVQVFRDNQPVVTAPLALVRARGADDPKRLPYEAELSLDALTPGRYQLRVTAVDRTAKTTATRQVSFEVR